MSSIPASLLMPIAALLAACGGGPSAGGGTIVDGNDTFATAQPVATDATTPGTISSPSDDDWYRFSTPGPGTVTVTLDALTADADLALHDPTQALVTASNSPGTSAETLTWTTSVGESLRVHVIPVTAPADYDLTVSFTPTPATDGNDTFATATAVAMGSVTTGSIGSATDEDWFAFWTPAAGTVFAKLSGLSGDADLELVDVAQVVLAAGASPGTSEEIVSQRVGAAGTFYAHVVPRGAGAAYTLTTGFVMDGAVDSNGTFDAAWHLPVGTMISELSSPSDEDWFRFTTTGAGTVTFTLDGLMADADLELYAEVSSLLVDASYSAGTAVETVTCTAATPLTYHVRVVALASITPYRLRAVFAP
jgi:hypothetical protein